MGVDEAPDFMFVFGKSKRYGAQSARQHTLTGRLLFKPYPVSLLAAYCGTSHYVTFGNHCVCVFVPAQAFVPNKVSVWI